MSDKGSQGESQLADDEGDGSEVESWLRKAARVPDGGGRMSLPLPGQVIGGKYRIEEQLGKGGMGAVYRATHTVSDKQVALKWMLRPATDERAKQRFTREARAAGRIDHPNVVDVYDIGQDGDAAYLVMELLRGESLRALLARGPLPTTAAMDLLLPAMRGVAAAHREGVIHRDLKPDNIFLCRAPDGEAREAKVLDFGISTVTTTEPDGKTTLTKEGAVLGTPSYMSPEQLESVRSVDARTDVYAFGVILYEALTGQLPFTADSYSALVLAIVNSRPRPPRELRREISPELERVLLQAIEKDRDKRVPSMEALIAALQPFGSAKSAGSGEHASIERQRSTVPGARSAVRWAAVLSLLVVLAALAVWAMRERAPIAAVPEAAMPAAPSVAARIEHVPTAPAPPLPVQPAGEAAVTAGQTERAVLSGTRDETAVQSGRAETEPSTRQQPRPRKERAGSPAATRTAGTRPPASPPVPGPPGPAQPRSGSIKVDEL